MYRLSRAIMHDASVSPKVARGDGDAATVDRGKQETESRSLPPSPLRGVSPQRNSTLLAVQRALAQRHTQVQVRENTGTTQGLQLHFISFSAFPTEQHCLCFRLKPKGAGEWKGVLVSALLN